MVCPYKIKSKKVVNQQNTEDNGITETVEITIWTPEECLKEECGAYHNGKCCYTGVVD